MMDLFDVPGAKEEIERTPKQKVYNALINTRMTLIQVLDKQLIEGPASTHKIADIDNPNQNTDMMQIKDSKFAKQVHAISGEITRREKIHGIHNRNS